MSLFNRNKKSLGKAPAMPPELNQYYKAEKRQQTAVTWALGFATLAVTIAVAFLLFFAARWVVNKVRDNQKPGGTTQEVNDEDAEGTQTAGNSPAVTSPSTAFKDAAQHVGGTNTTPTTPQTSSTTTSLPSTGPAETLAVFMVATTVGTFAYKLSSRKQ